MVFNPSTLVDDTNPLPVSATVNVGNVVTTVQSTAAAPSYVEGTADNPISSDLAGRLRVVDSTIGAVGDAAWVSGNGTAIALLKTVVAWVSRIYSSTATAAPGAALATTALAVAGTYNATPPTFADTNQGGLQLSAAGRLLVSDAQLATLITAIGAPSDTKWNGTDASASLIAIAKKIAVP